LDLPLNKVKVSLENARPALQFNQLTGGSNSVRSLYKAVRSAAAAAKAQMTAVAAERWGVKASSLKTVDGVITAPDGRRATYGSLAEAAAVSKRTPIEVKLKSAK